MINLFATLDLEEEVKSEKLLVTKNYAEFKKPRRLRFADIFLILSFTHKKLCQVKFNCHGTNARIFVAYDT